MGTFFVFIIKSSLCLAVFYLFFKLLLSRETFHRFNRAVLISLFLLAVAIPFVEIPLHRTVYKGLAMNLESMIAMAQLSDMHPDTDPVPDFRIIALMAIYFSGVAFAVCRVIVSLIRISLIIHSKNVEKEMLNGKYVLIIHQKNLAPFSWMRYIVISRQDYQESGLNIIIHEKEHIARLHSLDIMLAEAVKALQWFNPAAYLLKQEIQNIHEYQADQAVINNGIDAKQYQLLLIKKAVGARLYTIANSFNHSKLKTRITMISKKKSPKMAALKVLFVLPLTAFALVAFASDEVTSKMEVISNTKITEIFPQDTIKKEAKTQVKVKNQKGKTQNVVLHLNNNNSGNEDTVNIKIIRSNGEAPDASSVMIRKSNSSQAKTPLYIINGKEMDKDASDKINPEQIESISVLKDEKANSKYGEKGKNGVIEITLKTSEGNVNKTKENFILRLSDGSNSEAKPLFIVDGITMSKEKATSLSPDDIKNISVLKGETGVKIYGENAKNGVVIITTKKK